MRPARFLRHRGHVVEQIGERIDRMVESSDPTGFKHAYIDGGVTIQRFLAAGCIDRLVITRVPVLIGAGIPLFGPLPSDIALRHIETRCYNGGLVQSEYEIGAQGSEGTILPMSADLAISPT